MAAVNFRCTRLVRTVREETNNFSAPGYKRRPNPIAKKSKSKNLMIYIEMPPLYYQRPAHHYYVSPYSTNHHCGCGLDPRHQHRQPIVYRQPIYYEYSSINDYVQHQPKYRIQQEYLERKALEELFDAITLELNNISSTRDSSQDQSEPTEKTSPKLKRCPASRCVPSEAPAKKHKPTFTNQSTLNETPTLESVVAQFIGSSDPSTTHPLFALAKTFFENVHQQQQHQQQNGQEEQAGSSSSSAKDVKGKGVQIKSPGQPRKVEINVEEKQDEELARAIEESLKDLQAEQSAGDRSSSSEANQTSSSSSKSSSSPSEGGESMIEKLQKSSIPIVESSSDSSSEHGDWEKPEKNDE